MVDLSACVKEEISWHVFICINKSLWNVSENMQLKTAYKTQRILFYTFINNVSFSSETSNLFSVY